MTITDTVEAGTSSPPTPDRDAAARQLALRLLDRDPAWGRQWRARRAEALGQVLATITPASEHGRLLLAALQPRPDGQRNRPDVEQVARDLLASGRPPTAEAVAAEVADIATLDAMTDEQVRDEGRRAAEVVAEWWRTHDAGPTWAELGAAMGWPGRLANRRRIYKYAAAGWLRPGRAARSLRVGRLAGWPAAAPRGRDRAPAAGRGAP